MRISVNTVSGSFAKIVVDNGDSTIEASHLNDDEIKELIAEFSSAVAELASILVKNTKR